MFEQLNQTTSALNSATSSLSTLDPSNLALAGTTSSLIDLLWQRVTSASGFSASSAANYKFCNIDNMSISLKRT